MKSRWNAVVLLIFSILIICSLIFIGKTLTGRVTSTTLQIPSQQITYSNFVQQVSQNVMIQDLPNNAVISLRFYNFNTGQRAWEKSYLLKKASVIEGLADKPDITIVIHSKYLSQITSGNFCSIIKQAKVNNDLGVWTESSKLSLLWKFRSMLRYRDCLGF